MILIYILIALIAICCLLLLAIKPNRKRSLSILSKKLYAHRGVHDNQGEYPENSLGAFKKAVDLNYGIELDVHLSKDKVPIVFHDETLLRACNIDRNISDFTLEELEDIKLFKSKQVVPRLQEVLDLVHGKVPLIVELKNESTNIDDLPIIANVLDNYTGDYVIESFNPLVLSWYKKNRPHVIRGQLSTKIKTSKDASILVKIRDFLLENFLLNFLSKPDFLAFNYKYKGKLGFRLCKSFYKPLTAAFTIKNQKTLEQNLKDFHIFIFDNFIPNK